MRASIYVSATFMDLEAHRAALREVIRKLDHIDVSMEHYVAEPKRPIVRCLDDVRRCDLYIGLIARRYGYVPPGSELSITEQEFRAAVKHGKDILMFLLRDSAEWPKEFTESGEGARKLERWRNEVAEKYLSDFFGASDELAARAGPAISRALQLGSTPLDTERENRLMKEWRQGARRSERARARQALFNMGSPRYAAALMDILVESKDVDDIAAYMGELLAMSGTSRHAMPILVDLLHATDPDRRYFALFQVGELGLRGKEIRPEVVRELVSLEQDPVPAVRAQLAHALGKIHHFEAAVPAVRASLARLAADNDAEVRQRAQESVEALGG